MMITVTIWACSTPYQDVTPLQAGSVACIVLARHKGMHDLGIEVNHGTGIASQLIHQTPHTPSSRRLLVPLCIHKVGGQQLYILLYDSKGSAVNCMYAMTMQEHQ